MRAASRQGPWLPEPPEVDETYGRRGEHTLDWLARSTVRRAADCRRFVNEHVAKLPAKDQAQMMHNLRQRWSSAFLELVVARLLQEMGATIAIEETSLAGKRPDFSASFADCSVVVEATAPVVNGEVGEQAKRRIPLLDFIESHKPAGWSVGVSELPEVGPSDSQQPFQRAIRRILDVQPPQDGDEQREIVCELSSGVIRLMLVPNRVIEADELLWECGLGFCDNTESRVVHAVRRKRGQVRDAGLPVLLAVQAGGLSSDLGDFDRALFGRTFSRYGRTGEIEEVGFRADGEFAKKRAKSPTYAGVLAFISVGFNVCSAPVLYPHPRFEGTLPDAIMRLERHSYDPVRNEIVIDQASGASPVEGLNLVVG